MLCVKKPGIDVSADAMVAHAPYRAAIFASAKWDILEKLYTVMESFANHMPAFVPLSFFTAWAKVTESNICR